MNEALSPARRAKLAQTHWPLLASTLAIALLGVYNMHSSASHRAPSLWRTQLGWLGLGLLTLAVLSRLDYRVTKTFAYLSLLSTTLGLALVLAIGRSIMGARRWLALGPLTVQPSEFAKVALVFGLARYFSTRLPEGGYTIRALVRPLLWTRPAAAALLLLLSWRSPALTDPAGRLALAVHGRLAQPPPLEPTIWFRLLLIVCLALGAGLATTGLFALARRAALLHPWPDGRRQQLIGLVVGLCLAALCVLVWYWQEPWLTDPTGTALTALWRSAEARTAAPAAHVPLRWPRVGLSALLVSWGAMAYAFGRQGTSASSALVAPIDLIALPALLILVQPDLGSAILLVLTATSMVLAVGLRRRSLLFAGGWVALLSGALWLLVLQEYQKRRIATFIDPERDIRGAGWNAVQSLIAVGSGRFFGKGHRGGTQTQLSFLPEQHTDFAFSVWAEEQGLFGCGALILLYFSLSTLGLQIAARAKEPYGALLACGLTSLLMWQAVINIGMVIGVLPVVGIPLPLFSYGGSSVLTVMLSVGLLLSVHARTQR